MIFYLIFVQLYYLPILKSNKHFSDIAVLKRSTIDTSLLRKHKRIYSRKSKGAT